MKTKIRLENKDNINNIQLHIKQLLGQILTFFRFCSGDDLFFLSLSLTSRTDSGDTLKKFSTEIRRTHDVDEKVDGIIQFGHEQGYDSAVEEAK